MMTTKPFAKTRVTCKKCSAEWQNIYKEPLRVDGVALDVTVEYWQCAECGYVDPVHVVMEVDAGSLPEEGRFNSVKIPLTYEGWEANQELWERVMLPNLHDALLTTAQVEAEFHLAKGSAKKAAQRGYIPAEKHGALWLIRRRSAAIYWGNRIKDSE